MRSPIAWWRRLPRRMRIRLIAMVVIALVGAESLVFAPMVLEFAVLVDSLGVLFLLSVSWTLFRDSLWDFDQLRWLVRERIYVTSLLWSGRHPRLAMLSACAAGLVVDCLFGH